MVLFHLGGGQRDVRCHSQSSLGYGIGGIILGGILAIVAIVVLIVGLVMVAQLLGVGGMPAPAAG